MKTLSLLRTLILVTTLCLSSFSYAESVVVVVSATSPVSKLDKEQVANLFLGKSSSYPDGSAAAVPIEQTDATAAHEEFHKSITEKSASQLKSYWSKMIFSGKGTAPKEVSSNAELLKLISSNPAMIGYVDKTAADKTVKVVFAP